MDTDLRAIKAALAQVIDTELRALIDATSGVIQTAPGLLAWMEAACDWELNRRAGTDYELQPPEAAIPPEEDACGGGFCGAVETADHRSALGAFYSRFSSLVPVVITRILLSGLSRTRSKIRQFSNAA